MTDFSPIVKTEPPFRVLCLDGGGIFGYFTSLMLRQLCQAHPAFLRGSEITLLAGTSAGALISLLLARSPNPRDVVLSGELERFFSNDLLYSNNLEPIKGMLSLFGLTTWSGGADMMKLLDDHFGDLRMGDLKHRVLITSFNLSGKQSVPEKNRKWTPKIFYNFPNEEEDRALKVKDVAYGAACPATIRPVRNGDSDGGVFSLAPTITAIAKIVKDTEISKSQKQTLRALLDEFREPSLLMIGFLGKLLNFWTLERIKLWIDPGGTIPAPEPLPGNLFDSIISFVDQISFLPADFDTAALKAEMAHLIQSHEDAMGLLKADWESEDLDALLQIKSGLAKSKNNRDEYDTYMDFIVTHFQNALGDFIAFRQNTSTQEWSAEDIAKINILSKDFVGRSYALRCIMSVISMHLVLFRIVRKLANLTDMHLDTERITAIGNNFVFQLASIFTESLESETKSDDIPKYIKETTPEIAKENINKEMRRLISQLGNLEQTEDAIQEVIKLASLRFLDNIELLSMGVGSNKPFYVFPNFDFGMVPFGLLSTNPWQNAWYPPLITLPMDSSVEITNFEAEKLLNESYFRSDPECVGFPVPPIFVSLYLSRNPWWKQFLLYHIGEAAICAKAARSKEATVAWLKKRKWVN